MQHPSQTTVVDSNADTFPESTSPYHEASSGRTHKGVKFWLIISALVISLFLAILENLAVSTALPTIVADFNATQFIWVANAYAIPSAAVLPLSGGLAEVFGRRPIMLAALLLFSLGSAVGGAAQSMNMLIAGRAFQGAGAGGIYSLSSIIMSDLVTLQERGVYGGGLFGLTFAIAGGIGPIVGGSLSHHTRWRWLLYLNIPIAGFSAVLVLIFLHLPRPPGTLYEKLAKVDWIGNFIVMGSTCSCVIALTWGGTVYPWTSARVLTPLCIGSIGLCVFILYEARYSNAPIVPFTILSNRTSLSGYLQVFFSSFVLANVIYYLPVFYQACQGASPTASGVDIFGISFTAAPISVLTGASISIMKRYRPQIWLGWCIMAIGMGLISAITENTSRSVSLGYQVILGVGTGLVYAITMFPVLAPLPVSENAYALAFYTFVRSVAQVWGVTIGATVLQNKLNSNLPETFLGLYPDGAGIAYAIIPQIRNLPQPLRDEVRGAFAHSLAALWRILIAFVGVGLLVSLCMKELPLHTRTDEKWAMKNPEKEQSPRGAGRVNKA